MAESIEKQKKKQKKRGNPQNLKPFKKGVSGNPKGRPKKGSAIADILNEIGVAPDDKTGIENRRVMLTKVYMMAKNGDMAAVHFIADRTEGKAVERVIQEIVEDELVIE